MKVRTAPNKCILIGKIKRAQRESMSPPKFTLELEVLDARDVEGMPNFGKHHIGATIHATLLEDLSALTTGATIRCTAEYVGEPFAGSFRLSGLCETSQK